MNKKFLMLTCAAALLIGINSVRAVEEACRKICSRTGVDRGTAQKSRGNP